MSKNDYAKNAGAGAATGMAIGLVTFGPAGAATGGTVGAAVGAVNTYLSSDSDD